jgi:predicted nucleic acid-binding protein
VIVLDASVLVAQLDHNDAHHAQAQELLLHGAEQDLAASPVTLAEVLVAPARAGQIERAAAALDELGVRAVPLDVDAHVRLATLRARTGLKLPDCCVLLATEQVHGALATFDDRLAAVGRDHGHRVLGT